MKKIFGCVFFMVLAFSYTCLAASETEIWMSRLSHSFPPDERKEIREYVITHPALAKQILLFEHPRTGWHHAGKWVAYNCFEVSSYRGLITKEEFFDVGFKILSNIDLYSSPYFKEDSLEKYMGNLENYGWTDQSGGDLPELLKLFDSLQKSLLSMGKNGLVSNSGIRNSLAVKIDGAKDAIEKKQAKGTNQAISKIEAAINEANVQKGKAFNENACGVFLKFCSNLIWQINHTTF